MEDLSGLPGVASDFSESPTTSKASTSEALVLHIAHSRSHLCVLRPQSMYYSYIWSLLKECSALLSWTFFERRSLDQHARPRHEDPRPSQKLMQPGKRKV